MSAAQSPPLPNFTSTHTFGTPEWVHDFAAYQAAVNVSVREETTSELSSLQQMLATMTAQMTALANNTPHNAESSFRTKEPKINPPKAFTGKTEDAKQFTAQCDLVFRTSPKSYTTDENKICYAISFLQGDAFHWVEPHLDPDQKEPNWLTTWAQFKARLLQDFGYHDQADASRRALQKLRQTAGVTEYAIAFRRHSAFINDTDEAQRYAFFNGLREDVKERILDPSDSSTLEDLIVKATKFDALLSARTRNQAPPRPATTTYRTYTPAAATTTSVRSAPPTGPTPMDVDATSRVSKFRGPLTDAEKLRRRTLGLCSYCGGPGHFADSCPARRPGPRLNVSAAEYTPPAPPQGTITTLPDQ